MAGGVDDEIAVAAVSARLTRIERGVFGDHGSVGDRVSELRIHFGAGFRVYYTVRGRVIVLVLGGGTKRTQHRDIESAKTLAAML